MIEPTSICFETLGTMRRGRAGRWEISHEFNDGVRLDIVGRDATNGVTFVVASTNQADWFAEQFLTALLGNEAIAWRCFGGNPMSIYNDTDIGVCLVGTYTFKGEIVRQALK